MAALLVLLTGCPETRTCSDDTCPSGQVCGAGGCEPLAPPSATGDLGRFTSVTLTAEGRRVIATYDATHTNLVLAIERSDGALDKRIVDGFTVQDRKVVDRDAGKWPSLALDELNTLHLTWYDASSGQLRYASSPLESPRFVAETVDGGAVDRGAYTSLALSSDRLPSVAYRDRTERTLRYAARDAAGAWTTELVPACTGDGCDSEVAADYGEYARLVVINDKPRIVFFDRANGTLKLAEQVAGEWAVSVLDGDGATQSDVGRFAAVAVDSNERLAVAYFDGNRGALRLYRDSDQGTFPVVVDDGAYWQGEPNSGTARKALVGQHPSIVIDDKDNAVIVYLDATGLHLKLARVAGDQVAELRSLTLPAGGHIGLAREGSQGTLLGAYGAWLQGQAPRTRLELFTIVGQSEAP